MLVLVVEDDRSVRETIGVVLGAFSHEVVLASGGDSTLEALQAGARWPDAMLLDLKLQGETGEQVYQRILDQFGRVPPTVVISAAVEGADRAAHMPQGVRFLAKPYTVDELLAAVEQAGLAGFSSSKSA